MKLCCQYAFVSLNVELSTAEDVKKGTWSPSPPYQKGWNKLLSIPISLLNSSIHFHSPDVNENYCHSLSLRLMDIEWVAVALFSLVCPCNTSAAQPLIVCTIFLFHSSLIPKQIRTNHQTEAFRISQVDFLPICKFGNSCSK